MGLLDGKKALIFGVANDKSIAWAVAEAYRREGAEVALAYAGEAVAKRVIPLGESIGVSLMLPCDVRSDADLAQLFAQVGKAWGGLDILVHSVAFANKEELKGSFLNTTREGFAMALDISAYSLVAMTKEAAPLMLGRNGSIVAMTYYGAQKVFAQAQQPAPEIRDGVEIAADISAIMSKAKAFTAKEIVSLVKKVKTGKLAAGAFNPVKAAAAKPYGASATVLLMAMNQGLLSGSAVVKVMEVKQPVMQK